ncbi:MAG TPA: hypothetical protein VF796_07400 [Humisphaera sp.]
MVAVLIGFAGLAAWGLHWFRKSLEPVHDPARYADVMGDLRQRGYPYTAHFPATIPGDASAVRFSYQPGFLQGALLIQLQYTLPADRFAAVRRQVVAPTTAPSLGFEPLPHIDPLPNGFESITLGGQSLYGGDKGYAYGVAFDPATNGVIYWLEDW